MHKFIDYNNIDLSGVKELIKVLNEEGYISTSPKVSEDNLMDLEYKNALDKLYNKRVYLTLEELLITLSMAFSNEKFLEDLEKIILFNFKNKIY